MSQMPDAGQMQHSLHQLLQCEQPRIAVVELAALVTPLPSVSIVPYSTYRTMDTGY